MLFGEGLDLSVRFSSICLRPVSDFESYSHFSKQTAHIIPCITVGQKEYSLQSNKDNSHFTGIPCNPGAGSGSVGDRKPESDSSLFGDSSPSS